MLRAYIQKAMERAHYELIDQPGMPYYGEIRDLDGLVACGASLEECRRNLEDALDAWLTLGLQLKHPIPEVDGINLNHFQISA